MKNENIVANNRNAPCPCGSGHRYKSCCGEIIDNDLDSIKARALLALQNSNPKKAQLLFERALIISPSDPDSLHMLAVSHFQLNNLSLAIDLIIKALDATDWKIPFYRKNYGIFISKNLERLSSAHSNHPLAKKYQEQLRDKNRNTNDCTPLVSIIIPSFNHSPYIAKALTSVFNQNYEKCELIIIDDGSTDNSNSIIKNKLNNCPFPHKYISRPNKGSVATLHEGLSISSGEFINVLHSDDFFHEHRIHEMVQRIARTNREWGFSGVTFVDKNDKNLAGRNHPEATVLENEISKIPFAPTVGMALLTTNVSITTGNIFCKRSFLDKVGLRIFKYNDDWDFCLRATRLSEPVFIQDKLFNYRFHGNNTISNSGNGPLIEANAILKEYLTDALSGVDWPNYYAPSLHRWGNEFILRALSKGLGLLIDGDTLRSINAKYRPIS